jgi:HK97 family phage major capsid protein
VPTASRTSTALSDRLRAVEQDINRVRDERAAAIAERDQLRGQIEARGLSLDSSEFAKAKAAARRAGELGDRIAELQDRRGDILTTMGRGDEASATGGNGPEDFDHLDVDVNARGGWLAAVAQTFSGGGGGAMAAITTTTGGGAIRSTTDLSKPFLDRLALASGLMASQPTVVNITTTSVKLPRLTGPLPPSPPVPELTPMPSGDPPMDTIEVVPPKFGHVLALSLEAFRDARPPALAALEGELIRAVATGFDAASFHGAVDSAQVGIANTTGVAVIDAAGALANLDPFVQAIGALRRSAAEPSAIYLSPYTLERLMLLRKSADSNEPLVSGERAATDAPALSILGVPVFPSRGVQDGFAFVAQANELIVVRRSDVAIDTDPSYRFEEAGVGIRAIARLALLVAQPAAVAMIRNLPVPA